MSGPFKFDLFSESGTAVLTLEGRIDSVTANSFGPALDDLMAASEAVKVIDCGGLEYIGSGGLRPLLRIAQTRPAGVTLLLCAVSPEILSLLRTVGFLDLLEVVADRAAAAARVHGG